MTELLYQTHLAATALMTGVIWVVQLIQYPLLHRCPAEQFPDYHRDYTKRIGAIVVPAMLLELITGLWLFVVSDGMTRTLFGAGLALIAMIWLSTALLQVPCHRKLSAGYDARVHHRLVSSNWIRTVAWSVRLVLLLAVGRGM